MIKKKTYNFGSDLSQNNLKLLGLLKPPVQLAAFVYMGKMIQSPQKARTYIKNLCGKKVKFDGSSYIYDEFDSRVIFHLNCGDWGEFLKRWQTGHSIPIPQIKWEKL